jgi:arsenical pump membrane protein
MRLAIVGAHLLLAAAVVLSAVFAVRRPRALKASLIPWSLLLLASGLFRVMEAIRRLGASVLLNQLAGQGQGPVDLLRLAATGRCRSQSAEQSARLPGG